MERTPVNVHYERRAPAGEHVGCLALFLPEAALDVPAGLPEALQGPVQDAVALKEFTGKAGDEVLLYTGQADVPRLLLVGLGKADKLEREGVLRAAGKAAQRIRKLNTASGGLWVPAALQGDAAAAAAEMLAEGALLGGYVFEAYKAPPEEEPPREKLADLTVYDPEGRSSADSVAAGVARGEAVALARDLGNIPGNDMTPTRLAEAAEALAQRHGLGLRVLEREEIEALGMGCFMGVARGSRQPPKLILLEYRPEGAQGTLAFVGKGITFDSGGISIKPGAAMDEMKFDMCGAAAVLGAMEAIGRLRPAVNVVGIVPTCENLPDGNAVKPGDILRSYAGKTVEVLNTDAEGRLILADALAYGIEQYQPDGVVDLATLTGACVIALGHYATGAITNDEAFQAQVVAAGKRSGDIVWPLPNFPEYAEALKGKYGDLQNIGGRDGGAITGGLFLKNFVKETPWVHLDIAGTAWGVKNVGHVPNEGATGVGVRLLLDLATGWRREG